jgi:hypothetical protein
VDVRHALDEAVTEGLGGRTVWGWRLPRTILHAKPARIGPLYQARVPLGTAGQQPTRPLEESSVNTTFWPISRCKEAFMIKNARSWSLANGEKRFYWF